MSTAILKFGGSSVADNIKLNVVAEKIISLKEEFKNLVVVVSAQGKTTDKLLKEAEELSAIPEEREIDMLLSTGEQITASKLSILLNRMGHKAISLTGWQAGIITNSVHRNAKIEEICTERILKELEDGKIVIVTGFQGIDEQNEITTLGRGGSDTTAVALQAGLNADKCYIFSDVDGIYTADPNMIAMAKKLNEISFDEMQEIADSGAKVLHNRCIQIGEKFNCNIISKSTFSDNKGTVVCKKIENSEIKSIVKNEKLVKIKIQGEIKKENIEREIYQTLLNENIIVEAFKQNDEKRIDIEFRIQKAEQNKVQELLTNKYPEYNIKQQDITKLSIIGYGIIQDNEILNKVMNIFKQNELSFTEINLNQYKIEIITEKLSDDIIKEIHKQLIENDEMEGNNYGNNI